MTDWRQLACWLTTIALWQLSACGELDCTDPHGHPACLPDLEVTDFKISHGLGPDETEYLLCVDGTDQHVTVVNHGRTDAAPYKVALAMLDYQQTDIVFSCGMSVKAGTPAADTTVLAQRGCCRFDAKQLTSGRSYRILLMADVKQEIDESDEENNVAPSDLFQVTTGAALP